MHIHRQGIPCHDLIGGLRPWIENNFTGISCVLLFPSLLRFAHSVLVGINLSNLFIDLANYLDQGREVGQIIVSAST